MNKLKITFFGYPCSNIEGSEVNLSESEFVKNQAAALALSARHEIIRMTSKAQASHVASALSVVDILSVLYSGVANIGPHQLQDPQRDIILLSKGHAASALYAVLAIKNFFPLNWLSMYCQNDAYLGGHVTSHRVPGVELSTGSLGHGLPYAVGIALARKISRTPGKIFVIISDGECDEGTTWESALLANHFDLDNLILIIDRNGIQSLDSTENTLKLEPLSEKWKSFGWETEVVDGHNFEDLAASLTNLVGPKCVIAKTVKGRGVDFMENSVLWHYKSPSEADLLIAFEKLQERY